LSEQAIYEATALISMFNFTGRMEAASGLPMDQIPEGVQFPEATPGKPDSVGPCLRALQGPKAHTKTSVRAASNLGEFYFYSDGRKYRTGRGRMPGFRHCF
jgi:hypothetical protein